VFVEAASPAELATRLAAPDDGAAGSARLGVLQPTGEGPPVYCVHGGGGQVLSLASLAGRLGTERRFVGVQMLGEDRARSLFRVSRLAERYAREIAARQGSAPCVVAGHSYGGIVAQDLSRRLVDRGVPVELCLLLDTNVPRRRLLAGSRRRTRALAELDTTTTAKEIFYALHALTGRPPRPHRVTTERMIAALWGAAWHRVQTTPVPVVAIRAADDPTRAGPAAWETHTTGGFTMVDVPGGHNSMLAPPYVDGLASTVQAQLRTARPSPVS
jgi:thioesterase domain-containing protein